MKSTFWMTAQETEDEINRREELQQWIRIRHETGNIRYPYSDNVQFCPQHGINSEPINVCECRQCRVVPNGSIFCK